MKNLLSPFQCNLTLNISFNAVIHKRNKKKNSCIHLRLEDSQTCRHPALLSAPPTCGAECTIRQASSDSVKIIQDLLQSSTKASQLIPPPPPKSPYLFGGRPQRSPVPGPHRAKTHNQCPETHSAFRVQTTLLPAELSASLCPFFVRSLSFSAVTSEIRPA